MTHLIKAFFTSAFLLGTLTSAHSAIVRLDYAFDDTVLSGDFSYDDTTLWWSASGTGGYVLDKAVGTRNDMTENKWKAVIGLWK